MGGHTKPRKLSGWAADRASRTRLRGAGWRAGSIALNSRCTYSAGGSRRAGRRVMDMRGRGSRAKNGSAELPRHGVKKAGECRKMKGARAASERGRT